MDAKTFVTEKDNERGTSWSNNFDDLCTYFEEYAEIRMSEISAHQKAETIRSAKIAALEARLADATAKAEEALGDFYVAYSEPPEGAEECMATLRGDLVSLLAILKGGE